MKTNKLKTILCTGILMLFMTFLISCGKKEESTSFSINTNGVNSTVTYTYKEDEVTGQKTENIINYSDLGVDNEKDAKKSLESYTSLYKDIKGITYSSEYKKDKFVEEMSIDFSKVKFSEISSLPWVSVKPQKDSDKISFKESKKSIEKAGYKQVK